MFLRGHPVINAIFLERSTLAVIEGIQFMVGGR
jgi:hypothetical protein